MNIAMFSQFSTDIHVLFIEIFLDQTNIKNAKKLLLNSALLSCKQHKIIGS